MAPDPPPSSAADRDLRQARAELERRLRAGEDGDAAALLAERPALAADAEAAVELVCAELVLREELGRPRPADEWLARFPQYRDRLARVLELYEALRSSRADPPRGSTVTEAPDPAGGDPEGLPRRGPRGYELRGEVG